MKSGHCWEALCTVCTASGATECVFEREKPTSAPPQCFWCLSPTEWRYFYALPVSVGRMSGFSTSESDFVPHYNRAFGKRVGSLAEMKALQASHDTTDVVVKGDGAERHAPRDINRRVKRYNKLQEAQSRGEKYDAGSGVTFDFTGPSEE